MDAAEFWRTETLRERKELVEKWLPILRVMDNAALDALDTDDEDALSMLALGYQHVREKLPALGGCDAEYESEEC